MNAALALSYGTPDSVVFGQAPPPRLKPGQVLVAVRAAAVTRGDARILMASAPAGLALLLRLTFGIFRPRQPIPGMLFCGTVETESPGLPAGTRVVGNTGTAMGAHAEYVAISPDRLVPVPDGLDDCAAASLLFGGLAAADFLIDKARVRKGTRLLINGATGEVGCAALQIARHLGAETTAVCREENHALARKLGAFAAHDYRAGPPQGTWDVVLDIAGTLPWPLARNCVAPGGILLPVTATLSGILGASLRPHRSEGRRIFANTTTDGPDDIRRVLALYAEGALRPVFGGIFPFPQIRSAYVMAGTGHKRGSVVVRVAE